MRRLWIILALGLILTGCGAAEIYETLADEVVVSALAEPKQIQIDLPQDLTLPAMETDSGTLYLCNGYDVMLQTVESGDLDGTIRSISGYSREDLTVMETSAGECTRYEFVWTASAEDGERVCRAAILDDGSYHYCVSAMADADAAKEYQQIWNGMFESFGLN